MKLHRALALLLILPVLAGCSRAIEVRLVLSHGQPVLTFYSRGLFPRRLDSLCLWSTEIIDEASGKPALKLLASDYDRSCARLSQVTLTRPERGLKDLSPNGGLVSGQTYHAEVIADEGMGRSEAWVQQ